MNKYHLIIFVAVIFSAGCQILLKKGADKNVRKKFLSSFFNFYVIFAYIILLLVTISTLYAFKYVDYKYNVIILPLSSFFVCLMAIIFLKEKMSRFQFLGGIIIILGIIVFNL